MDPTMSHGEFEQLAAGFVLGALEPDDQRVFVEHLRACETCPQAVRELEEVLGKLAYTAPPVEPPPALRQAIMREVGSTRRRLPLPLARRHRVARPATRGLEAGPAAGPAAGARPGAGVRLVERLALAASIVALVAVSLWNVSLHHQNQQVNERLQGLALAGRLLTDPTTAKVQLTGPTAPSGAEATVVASFSSDQGVLLVRGLPPPAAGQVYELWSIPEGKLPNATKAGVFRAGTDLQAVAFALPIEPNTAFAITREPGPNGSAKPTSAPIMAGQAARA
jgi:anti-sigma-K factor RskA